uniref:Nucleoprotein n=1 Tax=Oba virus TaxID=2917765 RepID=A0AA86J2X4_9ORTO|nr:nucleoprotein [Oba virus]BDF92399.1 nucleoprotein [Oba virus]
MSARGRGATARKVRRVNLDMRDVSGRATRVQINRDPDMKTKVTIAIALAFRRINDLFGTDLNNLHHQIAVMTQLASVHAAMRQKAGAGGSVTRKYEAAEDIKLVIHGDQFEAKRLAIKNIYEAAIVEAGLKLHERANWNGSMTQIIAIWNLFGARMDDIRFTPDGITVSKGSDEEQGRSLNFKSMGIGAEYRLFCVGAHWPVSVKSALAASLGPLVQWGMLLVNKPPFDEKWADTIRNTLSYIPSIGGIVNFARNNTWGRTIDFMPDLCRIISFQGGRHQHRICFPPGLLCKQLIKEERSATGEPVLVVNKELAANLNYANIEAYRAWDAMKNEELVVNSTSGQKAQFLVAMAMTGGYVSDVAMLKFMFGKQQWPVRSEFTEFLSTLKRSANKVSAPVRIKMLIPEKWSKVSSALSVNLNPQPTETEGCDNVFAGRHYKLYKPSQFTATVAVREGKSYQTSLEIKADLEKYLQTIQDAAKNKDVVAGTVLWRSWASIHDTEMEVDEAVVDAGTYREEGRAYWTS